MIKPMLGNRRIRDAIRWIEAWKYHDMSVRDVKRGGNEIYAALMSGIPQAMGKLGSVELGAIRKYHRWSGHAEQEKRTQLDRLLLYTNAGVFPDDYPTLEAFAGLMCREVLPELTVIAVWFNIGEASIVKRYTPNAIRIALTSLESYGVPHNRWTQALKDRKILVVHPFETTIQAQYAKRLLIWKNNEDVLPEFELLTLKAPLSPVLAPPRYPNWFTALSHMQQQMATVDFDIALIGAGAYSLPLAVHAKKLGRIGIHLGGALQLYFGIMGGRWDENPAIQALVNESWVRPLPEDTPSGNVLIEGGCYW